MTAASLFSSDAAAAGRTAARGECVSAAAPQHVGGDAVSMTDAEREAEIKRLGDVVVQRYKVWAMEGCFAARGDADRASAQQRALILGRSPEQVHRMEVERGLA